MAIWDEQLPQASLNGTTFPLASRKVKGGRSFARKRYPFRNGQTTEDTGREPRVYDYEIPLFVGMDGFAGVKWSEPLYPDTYETLRQLAEGDDAQAYAELVDPEHGTIQVRIADYSWSTDPKARDGGILTLTLEEEIPSSSTFFAIQPDAQATAELEAENLDAALAGQIIVGLLPGFISVAAQVAQFVINVKRDGITFQEVAALLDSQRTSLTMIGAMPYLQAPAQYRALWSVSLILDAVTMTAESAIANGPRAVQWVSPVMMSSHDIAFEVYGDASMYLEVERLNPVANPLFYPANTTILVVT